jgi:hypothetical protein
MFNRAVVKMVSSNISKCVVAAFRCCSIQHAIAGLRQHRRAVAHFNQPEFGQGGQIGRTDRESFSRLALMSRSIQRNAMARSRLNWAKEFRDRSWVSRKRRRARLVPRCV